MGLGLRHRARLDEIVERHDLRLDEALLEVGVDDSRGLRSRRALADRPRTRFLGPRGEVGLQAEGVEADAGERVEARLVLADRLQELERFLVVEAGELGLDLGVEEDDLGGCEQVAHLLPERRVREFGLIGVDDVQERLGSEEEELADGLGVHPRGEDRRAGVEDLLRLLGRREDLDAVLVDARFLLQARDGLLERLQVGEDELGVDRLEVFRRVDATFDVDDVRIGERAQHLADRVGLADVRQELIAEPGALARSLDDARDVDEGHGRGKDALRPEDLREYGEPRVGHLDDPRVRLDRRKGVVGGEDVVLRECIEERRLADVGETDDADGERHSAPILGRGGIRLGFGCLCQTHCQTPRVRSLHGRWMARRQRTDRVPVGVARSWATACAGTRVGRTRNS